MNYEKVSALLSLLSALIITIINFYPWYGITYNGVPKAKMWGKIILSMGIALIIGSIIFLFYPDGKTKNIIDCPKNIETKQEIINVIDKNKIELMYNNSTGDLFTLFPDNFSPHTCVWTILGDHGSDTVIVTKESDMYNMRSFDYVGHVISDSIEIIKENKFLPPRVPIYVSCVDWQNKVYSGSIGEY